VIISQTTASTLKDDKEASNRDVVAYSNAINAGTKFVKVDKHVAELSKKEADEARSPYYLAVDKEEIMKEHAANQVVINEQKKTDDDADLEINASMD